MAAHHLSQRGYRVTIFERSSELGGALRLIPVYRLPKRVVDITIGNLLRIGHINVNYGVNLGPGGKTLADLEKEGYKAFFIATGTPQPRPLTFGRDLVKGADLRGVTFGLNILYEAGQGFLPLDYFKGQKVIVIGGGNVAFDVARTARRLGGEVTLVCLESPERELKMVSRQIPKKLKEPVKKESKLSFAVVKAK